MGCSLFKPFDMYTIVAMAFDLNCDTHKASHAFKGPLYDKMKHLTRSHFSNKCQYQNQLKCRVIKTEENRGSKNGIYKHSLCSIYKRPNHSNWDQKFRDPKHPLMQKQSDEHGHAWRVYEHDLLTSHDLSIVLINVMILSWVLIYRRAKLINVIQNDRNGDMKVYGIWAWDWLGVDKCVCGTRMWPKWRHYELTSSLFKQVSLITFCCIIITEIVTKQSKSAVN